MGLLYLGGPTIQEVDGKMMMGLYIYGVAVISGSLYSRFYGMLKVLKGSHVLGGLFCTVDLFSPYLEKRMGTAPWKVSSLLQLQGVG